MCKLTDNPVTQNQEDEENTPYCSGCGSEDITYLDQYANGEEYKCNECGGNFIVLC